MSSILWGYLAVVGSWIFFGSFGVPIKNKAVIQAQVDPVVYQAYKTTAVFVSCWLVLIYEKFTFTPWGIIGALLWVPNGVFAILAIRLAGLGVSQGLWSGLTVFVSFFWGTFFFHEEVNEWIWAICGLLLIAAGLIGVAFSISLKKTSSATPTENINTTDQEVANPSDTAQLLHDEQTSKVSQSFKERLGKKGLGIIFASYVGISNGCFMVPLHYAPPEARGIQYLFSFGVGAVIVTLFMWSVYVILRKVVKGWQEPIPSFHFRIAARPALLTGVLWGLGNYCSIYATLFLGQAVGFPLVQCQLLVAGLWGWLYYKEISGALSVSIFLSSAVAMLGGVALLSLYG